MGNVQDRLATIALVLMESAWLTAVLAAAGLALGGGGGPLGWFGVVAVLAVSLMLARFLSLILMPPAAGYIIQMMVGVIVIYLTVGAELSASFQGVDMGWVGNLNEETGIESYTLKAGLASIMAAAVWWRGGRLASSEFPVESLSHSFKVGIISLAIVAIVDVAHSADLNVFPMMLLFFSAGLAGMSIGHLLPASQRATASRTWPRVIAGVVAGVVFLGFLLSLLRENALSIVATPLKFVLNIIATVIFYVFILPLGYIVDFLIRGFARLFAVSPEERESPQLETGEGGFLETLRELQEMEQGGPSLLMQFIEWTVLAIIVLVALYLLARAFRKRIRWRRVDEEGERESVAEGADPAYDLAKLLFNLLPRRFRKAKHRYIISLPEGEPGVVDVFRLYFGLLTLAEERGIPRPATFTPNEYRPALEQEFPPDLVRGLTAAFNRACYGNLPCPRDQIDHMRDSLELMAEGKFPQVGQQQPS